MSVRVRFAPSPTGYLHVGGARTALFNWLLAKKTNGCFYLRIEDTDRTRYSEEALQNLIEELKWMGLFWQEGPQVGGDFGPYQQSERLELYHNAAWKLVEEGKAYPCFCTSERLEQLRAEQEKNGSAPGYDRHCRDLDLATAKARVAAGEAHVIRFKAPLLGEVHFKDALRGSITYTADTLDDLVLLKTDGFPTYHLASVVDDHMMQTTHVLRGEEWIPSTPKHVLLYEALGWQAPEFVHLPVILAPSGGKLSKRKGAASVFDHRDMGILPEALFNFLALLGWNPGDDREIMSQDELIEAFSLERLSLKSAVWDPEKLAWMNAQYIAKSSPERLLPFLLEGAKLAGFDLSSWDQSKLHTIILQVRERCKTTLDLFPQSELFFRLPEQFEEKDQKKALGKEGWQDRLQKISACLAQIENWEISEIDHAFHQLVESEGGGFGAWGMPLRFALTHKLGGPNLPEILWILGKEECQKRIALKL